MLPGPCLWQVRHGPRVVRVKGFGKLLVPVLCATAGRAWLWGASPSGVFPLLRGSPYREKAALKGCPRPCSTTSAEAWGCAVPMQREQELGMLMDPMLSQGCSKVCPRSQGWEACFCQVRYSPRVVWTEGTGILQRLELCAAAGRA